MPSSFLMFFLLSLGRYRGSKRENIRVKQLRLEGKAVVLQRLSPDALKQLPKPF